MVKHLLLSFVRFLKSNSAILQFVFSSIRVLIPLSLSLLSCRCDIQESDQLFVDLGSGSGKLVFSAALAFPSFKTCVGVELVGELHNMAMEAKTRFVAFRPSL